MEFDLSIIMPIMSWCAERKDKGMHTQELGR